MSAPSSQPRPHSPRHALRGVLVVAGAALGAMTSLVLVTLTEGLIARERLEPTRLDAVNPHSGVYGVERPGEPLRLAMMGDSLAVGYAASDDDHTPGVILARELSAASDRPVALTNVAEVGAETPALVVQLWQLREKRVVPDIAVIIVGSNDVMRLKRLTDSLLPLAAVVRDLRRRGAQVVVATCPDLGTVRPFFQPLRFFAHWASRVAATAQAIVVLRAGGRTVSLGDTLGPIFRKDPATMFSTRDHLHPSDVGYQAAADVILSSVCASAGCLVVDPDVRLPHRVYTRGRRHPLAWWAFRASRRVGARLTAAESRTAADPH